jgi:hypothetical protein
MRWHVKRQRGLESDPEPIRQRKNTGDDNGIARMKKGILSDGRAILNDAIEVRDGKIFISNIPGVDVAAPKDEILYARTLVPPGIGAAGKSP